MSEANEKLISLRPATGDDREFLLAIYETSREVELAMTPWDAAQKRLFAGLQLDAQTRHYEELYPDATHDIILHNDEPVGRIYVDRGEDQIAILDITVAPKHRKKGIGTALVKALLQEAGRTERSVRIYVENFNPSQKLFRDLGFEVAGEKDLNLMFQWRGQNI